MWEMIHARSQEGSSSGDVPEDSVSGNSRYEFHSRGLREEVSDVYYDVWVSGDTTPGVHSTMQGHCACLTPTSLCDCLLH